jgi:hypothetical protein
MKLPNTSPLCVANLICTECGNKLRLKIDRLNSGKPSAFSYYCDTCEYGFAAELDHVRGQTKKWEAKDQA